MRSIWLALIIIWHGKCETLTSSYILCSPCLNEYQCSRNLVVLTFLFQSSTLLPPQCFLSPSHSFSSWRTYLSQFLRVSLLETNSFGFCLISSLFLNNSFPRYRIHSWQVSFFFFSNIWEKKKILCFFLLASTVADEKSDRLHRGNESFFSGCFQDIFFFPSLVFKTLITMCLCVDFFGFNLFIVCKVSWIWMLCLLPNLECFQSLFLQIPFQLPFCSLLPGLPIQLLGLSLSSHGFLRLCSCFLSPVYLISIV